MRASRVLAVAIAALLLLAGALLWIQSGSASEDERPGSREAPRPGAEDSATGRTDPQLAPLELAPAGSSAEDGRQVAEGRWRETSGGDSGARVLRVTLAAPLGAPPDEHLAVVAVERTVLGDGAPADLLERFRAEGPPARGYLRAPVGGAGTIELALPVDFEDPMLLLSGRFLFMRRAVAVAPEDSEVVLAPELGGLFAVHLTGPLGEVPVGRLGLFGADFSGRRGGFERRNRETTESGTVLFEALDPDLAWTLMPNLDAHYADPLMGLEVEGGQELVINVDVLRGAAVLGRVLDGSGAPIAEAEVRTSGGNPWLGGGDTRRTLSAADGSFALRGLAPGKVQVEAERQGWREARSEEFELADGAERADVELVLDRGLAIAGRIEDPSGQLVGGATVSAERARTRGWGGWGGARVTEAARSDSAADGSFQLTGLAPGAYTLRATWTRAEDFAARGVLEDVEAGSAEVVLTVWDPLAFAGRVVDDLEAPVARFRLDVTATRDGGPRERQEFEQPEGRFRFARVGPGEWSVEVRAEGFVQPEAERVTLPRADEELVLRVQRTAHVEGRVLDPQGRAVAGAEVRYGDSRGRGGFAGGPGRPAAPVEETDEEGRFTLEDVRPGALELVALAEGWAESEPVRFELAPGEVRADVTLALRVGGRIEGLLLTPEGDPIAGRRVTWGENSMGFGSMGETDTDAVGEFVFDSVTPGEWSVSAVPSFADLGARMRGRGDPGAFAEVMGELVTETVVVRDGEVTRVFLGGTPRQPVRVFGTVRRAGAPVEGADVFAVSEGSAVFEGMKTARAGADGRYELVLDRPGAYVLSASVGDSGVEEAVDVPAALGPEGFLFDLRIPEGRIEGAVRGPEGRPLAGISLALQREDGLGRVRWNGARASTDERGSYAFESLAAGAYTVRANLSGWRARSEERLGAATISGVTVGADETRAGVDFRLELGGTVAGLVLGADGTPVAGASVFFRDEDGRLVSQVSGAVSDGAGRFEQSGLAPGRYTLSARADLEASADTVTVQVESEQTVEARLELELGTLLRVSLQAGEVNRRSRIEVFDDDGREVGSLLTLAALQTIFNQGASSVEQRLGPLPPGRYTVRATTPEGETAEKQVRLRGRGEEKEVRLRLDE